MIKKVATVVFVFLVFSGSLFAKTKENTEVVDSKRETWSVYFFMLYPAATRTITTSNQQIFYEPELSFGGGISKDHLRFEYGQYLKKPRVDFVFDVFPYAIATPYFGYIYSYEDRDKEGFNTLAMRSDALLGLTFRPIKYAEFYVEYLPRDNYFFFGLRAKYPFNLGLFSGKK